MSEESKPLKMRVIQHGDQAFDLDAEYAGPAIAAAISGESGEDVANTVIDYTDSERSNMDPDEFAIVSDGDRELWRGWLSGNRDGTPPPAGYEPDAAPPPAGDALAALAASWREAADDAAKGTAQVDMARKSVYLRCLTELRATASRAAGDALAALAKERDDAKALWLHATADRDRYHKLAAEILGHLHEQPGGAHSARVGKVQVAKWREALAPLGGQP